MDSGKLSGCDLLCLKYCNKSNETNVHDHFQIRSHCFKKNVKVHITCINLKMFIFYSCKKEI